MTERIRARVAAVLTERELVLNKGSEDGVAVGMRFAILNSKGADIKDPDTGESMGSVELEKTIVKVVRLQEHLSVARTFRTFRTGGTGFYIGGLLGDPPRVVSETLRTSERTYIEELDDSESYVKRGDPAVQVIGDEFLTDDEK
jgi:hypothetical protein